MVTALKGAPRSVRLARSAGLALILLGLCVALLASWRCGGAILVAGVALARAGGAWLHGVLPPMLVEGATPTPAEVSRAVLELYLSILSCFGLYSPLTL